MGISINEISVLEAILNEKFSKERLKFKMSVHFVKDRMNHPRNTPTITITKTQGIFNRLTTIYLSQLMRLNHNDSFNVRCAKSDINIPCAISKIKDAAGKDNREVIAITVMRKANFVSKDPIEFKL